MFKEVHLRLHGFEFRFNLAVLKLPWQCFLSMIISIGNERLPQASFHGDKRICVIRVADIYLSLNTELNTAFAGKNSQHKLCLHYAGT